MCVDAVRAAMIKSFGSYNCWHIEHTFETIAEKNTTTKSNGK